MIYVLLTKHVFPPCDGENRLFCHWIMFCFCCFVSDSQMDQTVEILKPSAFDHIPTGKITHVLPWYIFVCTNIFAKLEELRVRIWTIVAHRSFKRVVTLSVASVGLFRVLSTFNAVFEETYSSSFHPSITPWFSTWGLTETDRWALAFQNRSMEITITLKQALFCCVCVQSSCRFPFQIKRSTRSRRSRFEDASLRVLVLDMLLSCLLIHQRWWWIDAFSG